MSVMSIAPYFPFSRVKLKRQTVAEEGDIAWLEAEPDERYRPICSVCGKPARHIHGWDKRPLRDLNMGATRVWIGCAFRKVYCPGCGRVRVEDLAFFDPYQRVTRRLARYVHELCKKLTVQDVADHLGLNWKTVKRIDKAALEGRYAETDYTGLSILAVDEIAVHKGYRFMTVVLDYLTGRVVWLGQGRTTQTLRTFFAGMTPEQKQSLRAIAMDMHDPYISAVQTEVPHVRIVFDLFHVVAAFNKVIDRVRIDEYQRASRADRAVIKGTKYLLLKNPENLCHPRDHEHLQHLLRINETLALVMILKDILKQLWTSRDPAYVTHRLRTWCTLARLVPHPSVTQFARRLERYRYGILNHCEYPIHTGKLEGVNNKIKVIHRKAYGFHDDRYFSLKVIQAFDPLIGR